MKKNREGENETEVKHRGGTRNKDSCDRLAKQESHAREATRSLRKETGGAQLEDAENTSEGAN